MKIVFQAVILCLLIGANLAQSTAPYFISKYVQSQSGEFTLFSTTVSMSGIYENNFQRSLSKLPTFLFGLIRHFMNSPFLQQGFQLTVNALSQSSYSIFAIIYLDSSMSKLGIRYFAFIDVETAYPQSQLVFHSLSKIINFDGSSSMRTGTGNRMLTQRFNIVNDELKLKLNNKNISVSQFEQNSKISYFLHGFKLSSLSSGNTGFFVNLSLVMINSSTIQATYMTAYGCQIHLVRYGVIILVTKNSPLDIRLQTMTLNAGISYTDLVSQSHYYSSLLQSHDFLFGVQSLGNDDSNIRARYQFLYDANTPTYFSVQFNNKTLKIFHFITIAIGVKRCPFTHQSWTNQSLLQCTQCLQTSVPPLKGQNSQKICISCINGSEIYDPSSKSCIKIEIPISNETEVVIDNQTGMIIGIVIAIIVISGIAIAATVYYYVRKRRMMRVQAQTKNRLDRTHPTMDKIFNQVDIRIQ